MKKTKLKRTVARLTRPLKSCEVAINVDLSDERLILCGGLCAQAKVMLTRPSSAWSHRRAISPIVSEGESGLPIDNLRQFRAHLLMAKAP